MTRSAFDEFFSRTDLIWVDLTAAVVELATDLRGRQGLRTPDALQAACCLQLGDEAVMITGDASFRQVHRARLHPEMAQQLAAEDDLALTDCRWPGRW